MSNAKKNAAAKALEYVKKGMTLGLGSGSTVKEFVKLLCEKNAKEPLGLKCVCTSYDTRMQAIAGGLEVFELDQVDEVELAVDGADVATKGGLLKGGGSAMLREKIIGYAAKKFIIIVDESKVKEKLSGTVFIEVLPFAYPLVLKKLPKDTRNIRLKLSSEKLGPLITDNGGLVIACELDIRNAENAETSFNSIPGTFANGIFHKFDEIIVGNEKGAYVLE